MTRILTLDLRSNKINEIACLKELKSLNELMLGWNEITDIRILKELVELKALNLRSNKVVDFTQIEPLNKLIFLDLAFNNLTDPSFLTGFTGLERLFLQNNNIADINFLVGLEKLKELDLEWNEISDVKIISELKNLESLFLCGNQLADTEFLTKLTNIKELTLGFTYDKIDLENIRHLKNISTLKLYSQINNIEFIKELKELSELYLNHNSLNDVNFLAELKNLTELDLSNNEISDISFVKELKNLSKIKLTDNPITTPPESVWKEGIEAIRNYYEQIEKYGSDLLYEAKIILVGEPGAGKSTLVNKFKNVDYPVPNKDEKETMGINVSVKTFDHPNKENVTFRTNLWDFGGQDIQYTIHQFFLTSDALYLLVLDDRKENTDYDYWFSIIQVLGERSPVIVVLNELNKLGLPNYDHALYTRRYPELRIKRMEADFSKKDERLYSLLSTIKKDVTLLKDIGTPLPKQWIPIRNDLEKLADKNHMTYDEFMGICAKNGLTETNDQEFLARTFNRIGVILHFCNEPELFNTVFLNHKWVVDSLYTILKNKQLRDYNGLFTKQKMFELWGSEYSDAEKNQLLLLMQKDNFDLCYSVGDGKSDKFLFPSVLPIEKHPFVQQWNPDNSLRVRFQYVFMPKGITTRLIVRLSEYIYSENNQNIVWRGGAMLKRNNVLALISEDVNKSGGKIIDVCLEGPEFERRDFLIIIREEINRIHSAFSNLEVSEMVPCMCSECSLKSIPHFFKYEQLDKRRRLKKLTIECEESSTCEEVEVMKLLEGIETLRAKEEKELRDININVSPTITPTINQN